MKDRLHAAVRHPFLPYVVGFIIGTVGIYSVPLFAQEFREDRPPEERQKPPLEERREGLPGSGEERRSPPPREPFHGEGDGPKPLEGRLETRDRRPPGGAEDRSNMEMAEKFRLQEQERRNRPREEFRSGEIFKKPEGEGFFSPPRGEKPDERRTSMDGSEQRDQHQDTEAREKAFEQEQAAQEARQKEQEKRMLEQMKKGMKQAVRGLQNMKKMFDKWSAKGISLPTTCPETLTKAQSLVETVLKAESMEAIEDVSPEDLRDYMETLHECEQKGELLSRVPQVLKRVDREIKNVEKMWARAKKAAPDTATEVVSEGDRTLEAIKQARVKLGETIKVGEIEDLEDIIEDEIFGRFDDIRSDIQHLEAIRNAKKYLSEYTRQMKMARDYINKLKKASEDTSKLEEILLRAEQKYKEIKALKPGTEEFQDAVNELAELGQEFAEETGSDEDFSRELGGTETKR